MGLVAFALIGLVLGMLIRAFMSGEVPGGVLFTMVIGLVGGLAGGVFMSFIVGMDPLAQFFHLFAWAGAAGGALVLLLAYLLISEQK